MLLLSIWKDSLFLVSIMCTSVCGCVWMCACECWYGGGQELGVSLELEPSEVDAET